VKAVALPRQASTATNVLSAMKLASNIVGAPSSISLRVSLMRSSVA